MWTLKKTVRFEASHRLPHYIGKCHRDHGHSWQCHIRVSSDSLVSEGPLTGMVMDYASIKQPIQELLDNYLDHYCLNDTTGLENPTSEELSRWIYDKLKPAIPLLSSIEIEETCTCSCVYSP